MNLKQPELWCELKASAKRKSVKSLALMKQMLLQNSFTGKISDDEKRK